MGNFEKMEEPVVFEECPFGNYTWQQLTIYDWMEQLDAEEK